jgi:hypothetical protein
MMVTMNLGMIPYCVLRQVAHVSMRLLFVTEAAAISSLKNLKIVMPPPDC